MTCSGCTKAVEKALNNLGGTYYNLITFYIFTYLICLYFWEGMESINFDLEKKTVMVKTAKSPKEIIEAIKKTGKTAKITE